MQNKHINEFLDYYIKLENPQYAVLLKGKWGSGKTHFINKYKKQLDEKKQKYIYVSLYGVTSYDEIETKFLQSSNPEMFNEKSIFAGKLADAFIKENIKKTFGIIKKSLSSLNAKGNILIFDDLERCSINKVDLLGYINNFVEHQSYKVILIANEEELEKTDKYTLIKEKLIGKTFEFISEANSAYYSFLTELKNTNKVEENILEKYKDKILEIFKKSQCNNLRILRQGLFDFKRLYDLVFINHISKDNLINEIIQIFFILIFEIKSEKVCIFKKLKNDKGKAWDKILKETLTTNKKIEDENIEEKEKTVYEIISSKYDFLLEGNMILNIETWEEIIKNSYIDNNEIDSELKNSKYYFDENTPSWRNLTNFNNIEDSEFEELLQDVYEKFSNNEYKEYKQFKLIVSMLLFFQEENLFEVNYKDFDDLVKNNLRLLFDENSFSFEDIYFTQKEFMDSHYQNIGYFDSKLFENLKEFIKEILEEKKNLKLENDSKLIIQCIKEKNKSQLLDLLEGNDRRIINYKYDPILSQLNIDNLFDAFIKTDGLTMHYFGGIIKDRYNYQINELVSEQIFLEKLLYKIDEHLKTNKYKVSSYNLRKEIKENILIALEKIEEKKKTK